MLIDLNILIVKSFLMLLLFQITYKIFQFIIILLFNSLKFIKYMELKLNKVKLLLYFLEYFLIILYNNFHSYLQMI